MWGLSLKGCCVEVDLKCTEVSGKSCINQKGLSLGFLTK